MSVYDIVGKNIQVKCTPEPSLENYDIGDKIPLSDGLYICNEGWFVVSQWKVLMHGNIILDKWGNSLVTAEIINENNPVKQAVEELELEINLKTVEEMKNE